VTAQTMAEAGSEARRVAAERHCDLMRQGFMKGSPVPPPTPAQLKAGREYADMILRKLDRRA